MYSWGMYSSVKIRTSKISKNDSQPPTLLLIFYTGENAFKILVLILLLTSLIINYKDLGLRKTMNFAIVEISFNQNKRGQQKPLILLTDCRHGGGFPSGVPNARCLFF